MKTLRRITVLGLVLGCILYYLDDLSFTHGVCNVLKAFIHLILLILILILPFCWKVKGQAEENAAPNLTQEVAQKPWDEERIRTIKLFENQEGDIAYMTIYKKGRGHRKSLTK